MPTEVTALPDTHVVAEFVRERREDGHWVGMRLSDGRRQFVGPFDTKAEADRALADLQQMSRSLGGIDVPGGPAN